MRIFLILLMFLLSGIIITVHSQTAENMNSCAVEDCHANYFQKSLVHSPAEEDCESCHDRISSKEHPDSDGPEFELSDTGSDLCETCHDVDITKKIVHEPFADGSCLDCHTPHSSNLEALLKGNTQRDVCKKCHELNVEENHYEHGPFVSNQCIGCHSGHQTDYVGLVLMRVPALCFQCHEEREEDLNLETVHPAFEDDCLDCHAPHTAPAPSMLLTGGNELCFKCHDEFPIEMKTAKTVHRPVKQDGQCIMCHSPHASELSNLLIEKEPVICFQCHSENTENKEKFINIKSLMAKKYLHEPLIEGQCEDCHLPHFSSNYNLLIAAFPKGNYTRPKIKSYALCFKCHDSEMLKYKQTVSLTNFRDGSRNLHYVHVMKKKSISCQTCHDMHGADNEHLIGNYVYYGKWKMPIGYKVTDSGGSCLPGCHVQLSYDREK